MSEIVHAVYERGVLRPLDPLNLREQQRVRIQVWPEEEPAEEEVLRTLTQAGLMRPRPRRGSPPPPPLSEDERKALADEVGRAPGKSLSEIVIEDRGAW
ncbi:MAG: antitoxin family protein [Anaerolineae bacterium]